MTTRDRYPMRMTVPGLAPAKPGNAVPAGSEGRKTPWGTLKAYRTIIGGAVCAALLFIGSMAISTSESNNSPIPIPNAEDF